MALELEELFDSRKVSVTKEGFTESRVYHIKGEDDPSETILQLKPDLGSAHPVLPNTILTGIDVEPEEAVEVLKVTYTYEDILSDSGGDSAARNEAGEAWTFELTSQSTSIDSVERNKAPGANETGSYQTMTWTNQDNDDADMTQIGFNDGKAVAIDVYRPFESIRVNKVYSIAEIDGVFRNKLRAMRNTTNKAAWLNNEFGIQEVLFLGASINYDYPGQIATVDYSFLAGKKRVTKFVIKDPDALAGAGLTPKEMTYYPFDFIWLRFPPIGADEAQKEANNPAAGTEVKRYPSHIYHTRVYDQSDFEELGLVGPE